jgi:hypothetical protein
MKARIRLQSGGKLDLLVRDVSAIGIMVDRLGWNPQPNDRVLAQLEGLGFQPATVVWVENEQAGIAFEQLLHEVVLDQLKESLARAA